VPLSPLIVIKSLVSDEISHDAFVNTSDFRYTRIAIDDKGGQRMYILSRQGVTSNPKWLASFLLKDDVA
jgi:hypothetical protein